MPTFALLGQLIAPAFACGLNLYATVAVLGLASRFGWIPRLPEGLHGLEHELVVISAIALYLVEFVLDKVPHIDSLWDTIHTFIRPIAAALLVLAALSNTPLTTQIGGALLAGTTALLAHGSKAGMRLTINTVSRRPINTLLSLTEDALAVTIAFVALRHPIFAISVAGAALLLAIVAGPRLWRAFHLGLRALAARLRGFFGQAGWRELDELPTSFQALVNPPELAGTPPRAVRAALTGYRPAGAFRNGWLVISATGCEFLYRSRFRAQRLELPKPISARASTGPWVDTLELDAEPLRCVLLLLKDGPSAEVAREAMGVPAH